MRILMLIEDNPDGTVSLSVATEPPLEEGAPPQSDADYLARLLEHAVANFTEPSDAPAKRQPKKRT